MLLSPFDFTCGEFSASQLWGLYQTAESLQKGLQTREAASTTSVWIIEQLSPHQTRTRALNVTALVCAALKLNRTSRPKSRTAVNTALQPGLNHLRSDKNGLLLSGNVRITPTGCLQSTSLCQSWHTNSMSAARSNCMQWCASHLDMLILKQQPIL